MTRYSNNKHWLTSTGVSSIWSSRTREAWTIFLTTWKRYWKGVAKGSRTMLSYWTLSRVFRRRIALRTSLGSLRDRWMMPSHQSTLLKVKLGAAWIWWVYSHQETIQTWANLNQHLQLIQCLRRNSLWIGMVLLKSQLILANLWWVIQEHNKPDRKSQQIQTWE